MSHGFGIIGSIWSKLVAHGTCSNTLFERHRQYPSSGGLALSRNGSFGEVQIFSNLPLIIIIA
jgi:hypothetical protein